MAKSIKITAVVFFVCLLVFSGLIYVSFFGTPWGKVKAASILEKYVEEKYDMNVVEVKRTYNFKDGRYGVIFKDESNITFTAETKPGFLSDYYPEAVWRNQLTNNVKPIIKELFRDIPYEDIYIDGVYGMGQELKIGKHIPNYKQVPSEFFIAIRLTEKWDEKIETKVTEETYKLVNHFQQNQINNVTLSIYFADHDEKNWDYLEIKASDFYTIKTKDDLTQFVKHL